MNTLETLETPEAPEVSISDTITLGLTNIINGKEYPFYENAPEPRIAGVARQLISISESGDQIIEEYFDYTIGQKGSNAYSTEAYLQKQALVNKIEMNIRKENLEFEKTQASTLNDSKSSRGAGTFETGCPVNDNGIVQLPRVKTKNSEKLNIMNDMKQYGNLWVYEINLKETGDTKPKHAHEFDHMHLIVKGKANFIVYDDKDQDKIIHEETFTAPAWIEIPKGCPHQIKALRKNTIGYCIHPMRDSDDDLIDSDLRKSYAHILSTDLKEIKK